MKTWLCPVCAEISMPYGKTICEGPVVCGNEPHVTGRLYVDEDGKIKKPKRKTKKGIGISEVSNENQI